MGNGANFASPTNESQHITSQIFGFSRKKRFKYSKKYVSAKYLAKNKDKVGYLVVIANYAEQNGSYTSGAKAYSHCIDVWICDDEQVLSSTTIKGNIEGSTSMKNGGVVGPPPDGWAEEWVRATWEELIGEPSTLTA